ncbi:MAG: GNAT family N-acetyltransferase [Alphaproteobacteria bacterium]|jgi:ribosomal protein S18 acetylase RimI-like enzyme|nr:GNAT family N-acetyltransferase [Alphaproteobacteria bacterium]
MSEAEPALSVEIIRARSPDDQAEVKALFLEYAQSLDFSLCFQDFDREMETFPGMYGPPDGLLLLARVDGSAAGAIGLRFESQAGGGRICEMKRLYARPDFRRLGLGRRLTEALINGARELGYQAMRLDTMPSMITATALYRALGFRPIANYNQGPAELKHFELNLEKSPAT